MSIEGVSLKKGEIAFLWFNPYSGVTIKTSTKTLVFDPAEIDTELFTEVDAVLVTHEHHDHLSVPIVREIQKRTNCLVIADSTSARSLRAAIPPEKLEEAYLGSEHKIGNVRVKSEGFNHPAATPASYFITTEDNIKIYYTGDSLPFPDMRQIGEKNPPDLVFCTVGAPAPGASPETGVEIVKLVKPKAAVPYHAPLADMKRFCELLSKETPKVRCTLIERGRAYKYP